MNTCTSEFYCASGVEWESCLILSMIAGEEEHRCTKRKPRVMKETHIEGPNLDGESARVGHRSLDANKYLVYTSSHTRTLLIGTHVAKLGGKLPLEQPCTKL